MDIISKYIQGRHRKYVWGIVDENSSYMLRQAVREIICEPAETKIGLTGLTFSVNNVWIGYVK